MGFEKETRYFFRSDFFGTCIVCFRSACCLKVGGGLTGNPVVVRLAVRFLAVLVVRFVPLRLRVVELTLCRLRVAPVLAELVRLRAEPVRAELVFGRFAGIGGCPFL